jgi:hypothetical protein
MLRTSSPHTLIFQIAKDASKGPLISNVHRSYKQGDCHWSASQEGLQVIHYKGNGRSQAGTDPTKVPVFTDFRPCNLQFLEEWQSQTPPLPRAQEG